MFSNPTGGRVLIVGAMAALLIGACGASATPAPSAATATKAPTTTAAPGTAAPASTTPATAAPETPAATTDATPGVETPAPSDAVANDPIAALQDLTSYKLAITIGSKGVSGGLGAFGAIKMDGTIILKPAEAADITMSMGEGASALNIRMVEIGGKSYVDMGTGLIASTSSSDTSMIDSFRPEKLFGSMGASVGQMTVVGDETKNGVAAVHVKAGSDLLATAGASLGSAFGLADGTWSMDAWIAKEGGYAVSWVVKGTGAADASISISLDLANVNDPANKVVGP